MPVQPHFLVCIRGGRHLNLLFHDEFLRQHARVTVADETGPDAIALVQDQAFDGVFLVCPPVYDFEAARWEIDPVSWRFLEAKTSSRNAATPAVAVLVAPDRDTVSRMHALGVSRVIDLADRPSLRDVVTAVLDPTTGRAIADS